MRVNLFHSLQRAERISSCIHTIETALSALTPAPSSVHTSIVSQSVTVDHSHKLPAALIYSTLEDAGFDVMSSTATDGDDAGPSVVAGAIGHFRAGKQRTHTEQCVLCREEEEASYSNLMLARPIVGPEAEPAFSRLHIAEEGPDRKLSLSAHGDEHEDGPFRLTLSVGGMTCGACASTITKQVSDMQGVSEVAISLLSKSATVIIVHKKSAEAVVEIIEDCGFEAEIITCLPVALQDDSLDNGPRVVALRIGGMFCQ